MKRTTERLENGSWEQIKFSELITGDVFRLFEPTGECVQDKDGNCIFKALSNPRPYINENNEETLMIDFAARDDIQGSDITI